VDEALRRIEAALGEAARLLVPFTQGAVAFDDKGGGDPVTAADRALDELLRHRLPEADEGWLSEETVDDRSRLGKRRVWVVDPLDGTREFVAGIPEWSVSVGLVEDGQAVAGGVLNAATGEQFLGAIGCGLLSAGRPLDQLSPRASLEGAVVLASRSEVVRGEWDRFRGASFTVRPVGSIAYKMALVAAGLADATWTLVPKNEWDVAAGAALVRAAGGEVYTLDGRPPVFNRGRPLLAGIVAHRPGLAEAVGAELRLALPYSLLPASTPPV
jgi:myo-inositol-1(or 4)-monophosphatase